MHLNQALLACDTSCSVMSHRRLLHDDTRGVGEALNEEVCIDKACKGLMVGTSSIECKTSGTSFFLC